MKPKTIDIIGLDSCQYDNTGFCRMHNHEKPCPYERGKDFIKETSKRYKELSKEYHKAEIKKQSESDVATEKKG